MMAHDLSTSDYQQTVTWLPTLGSDVTATGNDDSNTIRAEEYYLKILYIVIGVVGILGNSFVILVVFYTPAMRKKLSNIFIINQSFADGFCAVSIIVTSVVPPDQDYTTWLGEFVCLVILTALPLWSSFYSSTYNLVALSIERYSEIVHPIAHKNSFTKKKALIIIVLVWLIGPIIQMPVDFATSYTQDGKCYVLAAWTSNGARQFFGVLNFTLQYFLPVCVFVICYTRMILALRRKVHPTTASTNANPRQDQMSRARRNLFKTLMLVTACFIICWSWNEFLFLAFTFGYQLNFTSAQYHISVIAVYVNCCINPFIYIFKYKAFQDGARKLFGIRTIHPITEVSTQSRSVTMTNNTGLTRVAS